MIARIVHCNGMLIAKFFCRTPSSIDSIVVNIKIIIFSCWADDSVNCWIVSFCKTIEFIMCNIDVNMSIAEGSIIRNCVQITFQSCTTLGTSSYIILYSSTHSCSVATASVAPPDGGSASRLLVRRAA